MLNICIVEAQKHLFYQNRLKNANTLTIKKIEEISLVFAPPPPKIGLCVKNPNFWHIQKVHVTARPMAFLRLHILTPYRYLNPIQKLQAKRKLTP